MLHKRIPLAFKIRDQLLEAEFDRLRTGARTGFGFAHYLDVVTEARLLKAFKNSLLLALTTCILTTGLAFALAYGINRGGIPMPSFVRYASLVPLVSPPVLIATAAILLFGRNGAFTYGILDEKLGWIDAGVTNLYGVGGVIVAQVLSFLPPAFIIMDKRALQARRPGGGSGGQPGGHPRSGLPARDASALSAGDHANPDPHVHPQHDRLRQSARHRKGHPGAGGGAVRRDSRLSKHGAGGGAGDVDDSARPRHLLRAGGDYRTQALRYRHCHRWSAGAGGFRGPLASV